MANVKDIKAEPVKITLSDGVERHVKFTLNAIATNVTEVDARSFCFFFNRRYLICFDNNSIKAVRCILWAGLMWEDPNLTEQQVGNLIDIQYLQNLMASIDGAFTADMPKPEKAQAIPAKAVGTVRDGTQDPNV